MRLYAIGGIAGGVAVAVAVLALIQFPSAEFALEVDAFKDQADVMGFIRVILTNTGRSTVTNIVVDFGSFNETLPKLPPGEKWIVSPSKAVDTSYVTVTADHDIKITKEFRSAPKVPGMIGGMG